MHTSDLPTWALINKLINGRSCNYSRLLLNSRMRATGTERLIELVAAEASYHGAPLPVEVPWDPAVAQEEQLELLALHPPHWKSP